MKTYLTFLLLLLAGSSYAQLQVLPHPAATRGTTKVENHAYSRTTQPGPISTLAAPGDSLLLPFWDDFSYRGQRPDSVLWPFNTTSTISYGEAINPPSWGVVTFDGVDANGTPYATTNTVGRTDSLQSAPIRLDALTDAEKSSVLFSFYWQLQGLGERPDQLDSLRLYFLDSDTVWHQVWSQGGNPDTDPTVFQQELINLQQIGTQRGVNFFHPGFTFKFQSFSRQNGQFDQWHIDWVYLNSGRNGAGYYEDRAISSAFTSLFSPYTAIPKEQLFANPAAYLKAENLFVVHSLWQPGVDEVLTYDLSVHTADNETVKVLESDRLLISNQGSLLRGQTYFTEDASGLTPADLAPLAERDSFTLVTRLLLRSEEPLEFFHRNDYLEISNPVKDYFAYDDGSAEISVSLNGRGQRLAYGFTLEEGDTLSSVSFYAPSFNTSANGSNLDLKIWTYLAGINGEADTLRYTQNVSVQRDAGVNGFVTYPLANPQVLRAGQFFIGFEQVTTNPVAVGFDLNTESTSQLYQSIDGIEWGATTSLQGSLMLRPHFGKVDPLTLGVKEKIFPPVSIYPNPTQDRLRIESQAQRLRLYDYQGRLILQQAATPGTELRLGQLEPGLYLLQLVYKNGVQSKRVVVVR
ncbi:T9SS type A sorting domain-containing protein [Cesiribacter sp. SM1]|uniref:T9SS type A sorting domain-containing protein n=1 Tax=Cesiribacter sp. SM1 TaxID=2861196 RepID=UPI001CD728E4|nr:T9SS type A sorting domain-containing protein [Cesiribacter sp. SM1]